MYWRFSKQLKKHIVEYLRKVFSYLSTVDNNQYEIIDLTNDIYDRLVYERWMEENEQYPVIVVSSEGGSLTNLSLNDHLDTLAYEEIKTTDIDNKIEFGITNPKAAVYFKSTESFTLDYISAQLANTGVGDEANINVNLHSGSLAAGPSAIILSSGSMWGFSNNSYQYMETIRLPMWPEYSIIKNNNYWISFNVENNSSSYYLGLNTTAITDGYASGSGSIWTIHSGSTGAIKIAGISKQRIGGAGEFTIRMDCSARDINTMSNIADISALYLGLAKTTNIDRTKSNILSLSFVRDWLKDEHGIKIKAIRFGGESSRQHGSSIGIIYTTTIFIEIQTTWYEDFDATMLEFLNIDETIHV